MFWKTKRTKYYLFYVIIAIGELIVQFFSSYLHDKYCIFASILLITNKRILYLNKLTWKYNVFMSMTWKLFFFKYECILCYKRCIEYKLANVSLMCGVVCTTDCYSGTHTSHFTDQISIYCWSFQILVKSASNEKYILY